MFYGFEIYYIICTLFLAGKDADSYQLKDKRDNPLSYARVKRWHRDGLILACLYILPFIIWYPEIGWKTCLASLLIRLVFFDLPFNHWASLPIRYIGGTAWVDRQFVRVFGQQGAVKKALTFLVLLLVQNFLIWRNLI